MRAKAVGTDEGGPDEWVDRHGDALFRYALSRVRDAGAAEDLVQETLLAAVRASEDFKHRSSERTWLIGILRHKVLDHFRHAAREKKVLVRRLEASVEEDEFDAEGGWKVEVAEWNTPEESLEKAEFWRAIETCVDDLPENLKAPFVLREFDGVDCDGLAEDLGVTKNNLWVMLSRARQKLRHCLQHRWFAQ